MRIGTTVLPISDRLHGNAGSPRQLALTDPGVAPYLQQHAQRTDDARWLEKVRASPIALPARDGSSAWRFYGRHARIG